MKGQTMNTRWHDLIVERLKDGGIHLEQQAGLDEPSVIHLHPQQLRHTAEQFGLVEANYPTDEMSKRLAEQLCRVYLDMADDYRYLSPTLENTFARLDGFIDGIPAPLFPSHLWDEREERQKSEKEISERQKQTQKAVAMTDNTHHQTTDETASTGQQMGLPMISIQSQQVN